MVEEKDKTAAIAASLVGLLIGGVAAYLYLTGKLPGVPPPGAEVKKVELSGVEVK